MTIDSHGNPWISVSLAFEGAHGEVLRIQAAMKKHQRGNFHHSQQLEPLKKAVEFAVAQYRAMVEVD